MTLHSLCLAVAGCLKRWRHAQTLWRITAALTGVLLAACAGQPTPQTFRVTVAPTQLLDAAPVYTETPTFTPTLTRTPTPTLTITPSPTPTLTVTPSLTPTLTPTLTATVTPTQPLYTLTPAERAGAPPAISSSPAALAPTAGWSCGDFPCADDVDSFMQRIHVPEAFALEHVGRFPGQPMQITYGPDGRLYATVIENGATRVGAVYVMAGDGSAERYSGSLLSPVGLAFQPGTDVLYVSGRMTPTAGGGIWRVPSGGGEPLTVIEDLPCCYSLIDNQPNGLIFGPDGYLYMGIGALTDHAEPPNPQRARMAEIDPLEAAVLRIQPHTGEVEAFASGLHNPYDLTFDSRGQFYATDQGLISGIGDRVVMVERGGHYGWPYWFARGCEECPFPQGRFNFLPDLLAFPDYSIPRGLVAYTGTQFPENYYDHLFVVLWNATENGQRVVRIDPANPPQPAEEAEFALAEPFMTGLIRPIDITLAPDGALVVADYIYGHVWRVSYGG